MPGREGRRPVELGRRARRRAGGRACFDALAEDAPELRVGERAPSRRPRGASPRCARGTRRGGRGARAGRAGPARRPSGARRRTRRRTRVRSEGRARRSRPCAHARGAQAARRAQRPRVDLRPGHARLVLVAIEEPQPLGLAVLCRANERFLERVSHRRPAAPAAPRDRRPTRGPASSPGSRLTRKWFSSSTTRVSMRTESSANVSTSGMSTLQRARVPEMLRGRRSRCRGESANAPSPPATLGAGPRLATRDLPRRSASRRIERVEDGEAQRRDPARVHEGEGRALERDREVVRVPQPAERPGHDPLAAGDHEDPRVPARPERPDHPPAERLREQHDRERGDPQPGDERAGEEEGLHRGSDRGGTRGAPP